MQGKLSHVIESQGLEIPVAYEDLIQEMKSYKKQGNPHYDDLVDGLLLANYQNDILFPVKPATGACAVIVDYNKGSVWSNFGKGTVKIIPNNQRKKGLFSR